MSQERCNVFCIGGPGFPYKTPEDVQALSKNIGNVTIFENSIAAYNAMKAGQIEEPIHAIIFTDQEVSDLRSRRLLTLVEKYQNTTPKKNPFFAVTTGEMKSFVSGEEIHSIAEFTNVLKTWDITGIEATHA